MKMEFTPLELAELMDEQRTRGISEGKTLMEGELLRAGPDAEDCLTVLRRNYQHVGTRLSAAFDYQGKGNKIEAIRIIREVLGVGLKDAKDIVEGKYMG